MKSMTETARMPAKLGALLFAAAVVAGMRFLQG